MSLDGHMILTTKHNEFYQAWLTFVEEDLNIQDDEIIFDSFRSNQMVEQNIKLKKKSIFRTPTIENEYLNLIKISNLN